MNHLVLMSSGESPLEYVPINALQEQKITHLIREKRIPEVFFIGTKRVISKNILGYTDRDEVRESGLKFDSWDDLRSWAHRQKWYRKSASKAIPKTKSVNRQVTLN